MAKIRTCPYCQERINLYAKKCISCNELLTFWRMFKEYLRLRSDLSNKRKLVKCKKSEVSKYEHQVNRKIFHNNRLKNLTAGDRLKMYYNGERTQIEIVAKYPDRALVRRKSKRWPHNWVAQSEEAYYDKFIF